MAVCPKCSYSKNPARARTCAQCGHQLDGKTDSGPASGTLNVSSSFAPEAEGSAGVPEGNRDSAAEAESPDAGSGTVLLPATGPAGIPAAPVTDGMGTVPTGDPVSEAGPGPERTLITDHIKTVDYGSAGVLPPGRTIQEDTEKTVNLESRSVPQSQAGGGSEVQPGGTSGSRGRLKRMWEGAAGSSANPMHSLRAEAQATDSVFRRVAVRTVARSPGEAESPDYELLEKIGEGAMGVVYSARQKAIGRVVAIKAIKEGATTSDDSRRKFFYEAQITGELDHPNIVPIHELGASQDGMLFYSMKLIGGTEWQKVIRNRSRDQNVETLMKVADAMAFAHSRGVIHRDLKPENTMLGKYGEVFVTDWGLAVNYRTDRSFNLGGTPAYMAPEMAGHRIEEIGPTSDIYLLGAILFQIVTGVPPHRGKTVTQCLLSAFENEICATTESDALLEIAYRAMQMQPENRYPTVEAMQEAIRQYRRNAESIALSRRSDELLEQSIGSGDYERFSRSIFGYQDAIELWSDNQPAQEGLRKARLAYGKAAFARGDFDLCLQSLDQNVPAERELYLQAEKSKRNAELREARFKSLRRILAAVVLFGLIGMSTLAALAWSQRGFAIAERDKAISAKEGETAALKKSNESLAEALAAKEAETLAKEAETVALGKAQKSLAEAIAAKEAETLAKEAESVALGKAQKSLAEAIAAKEAETLAKEAETAALGEAQKSLAEAIAARKAESEALAVARRRAAEVELGNFQSRLALAKSRVEQASIGEGEKLLMDLVDPGSYQALAAQTAGNTPGEAAQPAAIPNFESWAWRRIRLLSNSDLPAVDLAAPISTMDFAPAAGTGLVGTTQGRLKSFRYEDGSLIEREGPLLNAPIDGVAISPDGLEAVYSVDRPGLDTTVFHWNLASGEMMTPIASLQRRSIQEVAITESLVIAGINEGLWIWNRQPAWHLQPPQYRLEDVRGRLLSMQVASERSLLLLAELDGLPILYLVDLSAMKAEPVKLPASLAGDLTAAALAASGTELVIGTLQGRLFSGSIVAGEFQNPLEIVPARHQSAVHSIRLHADNTLLTSAVEPVVQVWKATPGVGAGWEPDTALSGTAGNIVETAFGRNSREVLAVDADGKTMLWNSDRQKQRFRLERTARGSTDETLRYVAPVNQVFHSASNRAAVAVDQNGVLDQWSLLDGRTIANPSGDRWSWLGHTPGSRFVDMAIDEKSSTLVTVVRLPDPGTAERDYLAPENTDNHEFCHWDLASGRMVRRWTSQSDIAARISLFAGGTQFLAADDNFTRIRSVADSSTGYDNSGSRGAFGTDFSVPHPARAGISMLVKRSGSVCLFDEAKPDDTRRDTSLANNDDVPLRGVWAADGKRFFLVFTSGSIVVFAVDDSGVRIETGHSLRVGAPQERIAGRNHVDLLSGKSSGDDELLVAVRLPGSELRTELHRVRISPTETLPGSVTTEQRDGRLYLLGSSPDHPQLSVVPGLDADTGSVEPEAVLAGEKHIYLATRDGDVWRVDREGTRRQMFGNPRAERAAAKADGSMAVILGRGGLLYRLQRESAGWNWEWTSLPTGPAGIAAIELSSDGRYLAQLCSPGIGNCRTEVIDTADGGRVLELDGAVDVVWDRADPASLFVVFTDGRLERHTVGQPGGRRISELAVSDGETIVGLHRFMESWTGGRPASEWLAVHTETAVSGFVHYVRTEATAADGGGADSPREPGRLPLNSVLAMSPTDGLMVVGSAGSIAVWFAAPGLGESGKPLYDLPGHSGADLRSIGFSPDGQTLVTTDNLRRVYAWMSEDPWHGIVPPGRNETEILALGN